MHTRLEVVGRTSELPLCVEYLIRSRPRVSTSCVFKMSELTTEQRLDQGFRQFLAGLLFLPLQFPEETKVRKGTEISSSEIPDGGGGGWRMRPLPESMTTEGGQVSLEPQR